MSGDWVYEEMKPIADAPATLQAAQTAQNKNPSL